MTACNDYEPVFAYTPKVQFSVGEIEIEEGQAPITVTVQLVGPQRSSPTEVNFQAGGTAVAGQDYTLGANGSVSIPAGASSAEFTLSILDDAMFSSEERMLELTITGVSDGISAGNDGEDRKTLMVTILENDCSIDWIAGAYSVRTTDTNPSQCEGTVGTINITDQGNNNFRATDITGGVYKNCFSLQDSPGNLVLRGDSIFIVNQQDILGDIINGRGRVETCDRTFTITWSNTFGDMGTTLYTRQ